MPVQLWLTSYTTIQIMGKLKSIELDSEGLTVDTTDKQVLIETFFMAVPRLKQEASLTPALAVISCGCFLPDLTRFTTPQCGETRQFFNQQFENYRAGITALP